MSKNQLSEDISLQQEWWNEIYKGFFSHDISIRLWKKLMQITNGDNFFEKKVNEWAGTALSMTEAQENIESSIHTSLIRYFQLLSQQNIFTDDRTEVYIDETDLVWVIASRLWYPDSGLRLQLATDIMGAIKSKIAIRPLVFQDDGFIVLNTQRGLMFHKI